MFIQVCFNNSPVVFLTVQSSDTPIEYLKSIGPQRAEVLKSELGIFFFGQLLLHYPFRYVDRSSFQSVSEVHEEMPYVQLKGKIESIEIVGVKHTKRLVAIFSDATGKLELVWFQGVNWMAKKLQLETNYVVFGKVSNFKGRLNMAHPEVEEEANAIKKSAFQAVYNSTEKLKLRGLDSEGIRKAMQYLFEQIQPNDFPETQTESVRNRLGLLDRFTALKWVHFPETSVHAEKAVYTIKFDELFYIQLRLLRLNKLRKREVAGPVFSRVGPLFNDFYSDHLPFELTGAQKRVLRELRNDMGTGKQMNRLVQGDVGSGKTLVALMAMLLAADNGFQSCLMAPTEILAQQHFETFTQLLSKTSVSIKLLTGSVKQKDRRPLLTAAADGSLNILIGTHALIEDAVAFKQLGLVVIDEQHRFGVAQRARLMDKAYLPPHMLIMTATPIPRTLAMTFYGDLDTSVIDELPPGRKPIKTFHYTEPYRLRLNGFIREQIGLGRQVYIVYPLIKESEKMDFQDLQRGYDTIVNEFPPPQFQVSIVHGKLTPAQKEFEMQRFIKGETHIMVATTVIEVGVNVPNASVMVIESAERFGLSQLHQLRGRVGRGAEQSFCILMTGVKLSADSRLRMETMTRTNDGFEISEVDLKLRGPGDLEGTQQSGVVDLRLANLAQDGQILSLARQVAEEILEKDPNLQLTEHQTYATQLEELNRQRKDWSRIG